MLRVLRIGAAIAGGLSGGLAGCGADDGGAAQLRHPAQATLSQPDATEADPALSDLGASAHGGITPVHPATGQVK